MSFGIGGFFWTWSASDLCQKALFLMVMAHFGNSWKNGIRICPISAARSTSFCGPRAWWLRGRSKTNARNFFLTLFAPCCGLEPKRRQKNILKNFGTRLFFLQGRRDRSSLSGRRSLTVSCADKNDGDISNSRAHQTRLRMSLAKRKQGSRPDEEAKTRSLQNCSLMISSCVSRNRPSPTINATVPEKTDKKRRPPRGAPKAIKRFRAGGGRALKQDHDARQRTFGRRTSNRLMRQTELSTVSKPRVSCVFPPSPRLSLA